MSSLYSFLSKSDEEIAKEKEEEYKKIAERKREERTKEMGQAYKDAKPVHAAGEAPIRQAFTQVLDKEGIAHFSEIAHQPFSRQAVSFLNAYWDEIGDQAEFIFSCAYETMKYADMHAKGVMYIHLYDEGCDVDFNIGLYFYEKLAKKIYEDPEGAKWRVDPRFKISLPEEMTAIARKSELREKVDVDFDGRISFLEYLLYQYRSICNPGDFVQRDLKKVTVKESAQMRLARIALDEVNAAIRAYQTEKIRLETEANGTGVKALGAKNMLAQLLSSPLASKLQTALIKAEAAVRLATKQAKEEEEAAKKLDPKVKPMNPGNLFWMNMDLAEKKKQYGKKE